MSKYSLSNGYVEPKEEKVTEASVEGVPREWKPTVRLQKRASDMVTKIRISDLYPDKQYIKEVNDGELRYFLLLILPVAVAAFFSTVQRDNLYNKFIDYIVRLFSGI